MPRNRRMMDYLARRDMARGGHDMRNPYGSMGGYSTSRRSLRDGLMMDDMRMYNRGESDYELADLTRQNQEIRHDPYMPRDYARGRMRDYGTGEPYAGVDDFYNRRDGHYPMNEGKTYYPIEAMGTFNGYWGRPQEDYGYDMRYDMRMRDYAGDYGEKLTNEELEHWCKKMMSELDEREKQMFSKEAILQRAKNMGIQFDKFSEMEFYVNVVKNYTDHKKSIGENPDMAIKLAKDDFFDEDGQYKGSEWLAVYYDTFVED